MRVAAHDMAAAQRVHEPHLDFLLIIVAIDIFTLKLDKVLLYLVLMIPYINKAIIVLIAFLLVKHQLLLLFLIKRIILVSFLCLQALFRLDGFAAQYYSINRCNS